MTRPAPSVVLFVGSVPRMAAFYRELAAMRIAHEADDHVVLEIGGLQLVIHALRGEPAPPDSDAPGLTPLPVREDAYLKLGLPVRSIAAARATALAHGGEIGSVEREWEARGFRACDGHDPEGNVIQVRESVE
ncbi:MAG: VOC family protein [Thermoanaerobaculia bacterium]